MQSLMKSLSRMPESELRGKPTALAIVLRKMPMRLDSIGELPYYLPLTPFRDPKTFYSYHFPRKTEEEKVRGAVVVTQGLMSTKPTSRLMISRLRKEGYLPILTDTGFRNPVHPEEVIKRIAKAVREGYERTGKKVHLLGHSLGGMLNLIHAARNPFKIESVITLASPLNKPVEVHPFTYYILMRMARKFGEDVIRGVIEDASKARLPAHIKMVSIRATNDGILNGEGCVRSGAENREIETRHLAMSYDLRVFESIAEILRGRKGRTSR